MDALSPAKENDWQHQHQRQRSMSPTKMAIGCSPSKASRMVKERGGEKTASSSRHRLDSSPSKGHSAAHSRDKLLLSPAKKAALGDKSNHRGTQSPSKPQASGAAGDNGAADDDIEKDIISKSHSKNVSLQPPRNMSPTKSRSKSEGKSRERQQQQTETAGNETIAGLSASLSPPASSAHLNDAKVILTPPLANDPPAFMTPAANIGKAGMAKYRRGEAMDAAMGVGMGLDDPIMAAGEMGAAAGVDGGAEVAQSSEPDMVMTEEELYPEIEYMPPSDYAKNPPVHFPPILDGMPRASELGDIMRSLPFSGFVSHARAALDPVERDLFQVDMETTMSSFDAFDRELERKLDEYYASCTLWDNDEETEYFFSTPLWEQQPKGLRNRDAPAKSNVAITAVARSNTQSTKGGIGGGRASRAPSAMSNRSATGKSIKAAPSVTGAGSASSVSAKRAATVNKGAVSARATALRPGSRIVANASTSVNGVRSTAAATATAYASVARRTTSTGAGAAPSKQAAAASMSVALSRTLGIQTPSSITSAARSGVRPPGVLRATKQQVRQPAPSATRAGPGASSKKRPPPLFDWRANEHDRLTEWTETTLAQMEAEVDARVVEL